MIVVSGILTQALAYACKHDIQHATHVTAILERRPDARSDARTCEILEHIPRWQR